MTWLTRCWVWLAQAAAAIGMTQCPVCRRWRQDPTDYCPGCDW